LADFPAIWALATPVEQTQILRLMLKEGQVDGEQVTGIRWYRPFGELLRSDPEAETRADKSARTEEEAMP